MTFIINKKLMESRHSPRHHKLCGLQGSISRSYVDAAVALMMGTAVERGTAANATSSSKWKRQGSLPGLIPILCMSLSACASDDDPTLVIQRSGGDATTLNRSGGAFETAAPNLTQKGSYQTLDWRRRLRSALPLIAPYCDLLLHDLGNELADHRPDFDATGSEWLTAPLWGIGLTENVLGE